MTRELPNCNIILCIYSLLTLNPKAQVISIQVEFPYCDIISISGYIQVSQIPKIVRIFPTKR